MRYIDYGTMQSDARRRVLEMQRRASGAVWQQEQEKAQPERQEPMAVPDSCEWQSEADFAMQPDEQKRGEQCKTAKKHTLTDNAKGDPEQLLLLAVLVLLLAEKADTVLILAMVYLLI